MARYTNHDDIAAHALGIQADVRDPDVGPLFLYSELTHACRTDPERMAQVLYALALMVPAEPEHALAERIRSVVDARVEVLQWRVSC